MKIATPPAKSHPLFPSNPPLKLEVLQTPLFENLVGGSTLPTAERGVVPTMSGPYKFFLCITKWHETNAAQKMKFSIQEFFSKYDQI